MCYHIAMLLNIFPASCVKLPLDAGVKLWLTQSNAIISPNYVQTERTLSIFFCVAISEISS